MELIAMVGRAHITADATQFCPEQGIVVAWFRANGDFLGRLVPELSRSAGLRLEQFRLAGQVRGRTPYRPLILRKFVRSRVMARFVVCYDVVSNQRRRKVASCLDAYGDRVQDSVFELPVDRPLLDQCISELSGLINAAEDRVTVYRLCASCESERFYLGVGETAEPIGEEPVFIV